MKRCTGIHLKVIALGFTLPVLATPVFAQPKTIRVPQDHGTVQAAIDAAVNGDTVLVDEGTYSVNLLLNKKITLASRFLVDRDTMHIQRTILDGSTPTEPDSASVIRIMLGTDSTTAIIGFTIRKGLGTRCYDNAIAAYWRMGGGIMFLAGAATIRNNIIRDHYLVSDIDGVDGGGICMWPFAGPIGTWIIQDNVIVNNWISCTSTANGLGTEGGGAFIFGTGLFVGNTVDSNTVNSVNFGRGGGICITGAYGYGRSSTMVANNRIRHNYSKYNGGGVFVIGSPESRANVTFTNNLMSKNVAVRHGGAFFISTNADATLINNTVVGNFAGNTSDGLIAYGDAEIASHPVVLGINNIFWNSSSNPNEIWGVDWDSFHYNLIRGSSLHGSHNFTADPLLLDDGSGRLAFNSPCIGAGTSSLVVHGATLQAPSTDLFGAPVPQPAGTAPDLGAVQSSEATSTATRIQRAEVRSFMHGGILRWYGVVRPLGRESEAGRPVLLYLPGYGGTADGDMNWLQLHLHADTVGYLTVYAQGVQRRWNSGITRGSNFPTPTTDDVGFVSALIDTLRVQYAIDTNRVFVAGFSNGGFMAYRLAATISHRLAGVAAIAARLPESTVGMLNVSNPRIPVLIANGTADPTVPYSTVLTGWRSVPATVQFWRDRNGASTVSDTRIIDGNPADVSSVNRYIYGADLPYDSRGIRPEVRLYEIYSGGHEWPGSPAYYGSGIINRDISMNEEIVDFFSLVTGIEDHPARDGQVPSECALDQNFPNPFNPETKIRYGIKERAWVKISVFDLLGRDVSVLVDGEREAGYHEAVFGSQNSDVRIPSGVYFYRMTVTGLDGQRYDLTKRMMLVK